MGGRLTGPGLPPPPANPPSAAVGPCSAKYKTATPGPGSYNLGKESPRTVKGTSSARYTMGERYVHPQDPAANSKRNRTPGPAQYITEGKSGTKSGTKGSSAPAYTIATRGGQRGKPGKGGQTETKQERKDREKREMLKNQTPGPGEYSVEVKVASGPQKGFSLGKRLERVSKIYGGGPGPAAYNLRKGKAGGPAFTMGASRKPDSEVVSVPGPGAYHREKVSYEKKGVSIAFRNRTETRDSNQTPGPAEYSPRGRTMTSGDGVPRYSLTGRNFPGAPLVPRHRTPGPGHYSVHEKSAVKTGSDQAPAYSMVGRPDEAAQKYKGTPGPIYTPKIANGRSAPAYSLQFRKKSKPQTKWAATPGPGEYNSPYAAKSGVHLRNPAAYSMGKKLKKSWQSVG